MLVTFWPLTSDTIIGLRSVFYLMKSSWDTHSEHWVLLNVHVLILNLQVKFSKIWDEMVNQMCITFILTLATEHKTACHWTIEVTDPPWRVGCDRTWSNSCTEGCCWVSDLSAVPPDSRSSGLAQTSLTQSDAHSWDPGEAESPPARENQWLRHSLVPQGNC